MEPSTDPTDSAAPTRQASDGTSRPARAVERVTRRATAYESWLWLAALLALVADAALTAHGLRNGYAEANPIAAALVRSVGLPAAVVALKSFALAVAGVGWAVLPAAYRGVAPLCLLAPWGVGVAVNLVVLL
jgi:hypothetical protein